MSSQSAQQREYFHKQLNFIQRITTVVPTWIINKNKENYAEEDTIYYHLLW